RVFRGLDPLRRALDRAIAGQGKKAAVAREGREVIEWLIGQIEPVDRPRTWARQADEARALASSLRFGSAALDALFLALDDHAAALDGLELGDRAWRWPEFVRALESIADDL